MFNALVPALVIARREVRDQLRDWRIIFPVLGLTIFFPFLMNFTANQILNFVKDYGANIIGERLVPFLMLIVGFFPISVSLVIALETFVGEKERGSIEPLLNTPLKDWQLYLGKLLAATVPPLISSFLGMSVYTAGLFAQNIPLPEADILVIIILLTIIQAFVMVAGAVVVSTQATSVRAANLLASFIIIPMALLVQSEAVIMFWGDYRQLWLFMFGLIVLTILLVRVGLAHFQREELLGREIDVLNLRWGLGVFKRKFLGGAKSVPDWFLRVVPEAIVGIRRGILVMTLVAVAGVVVGASLVSSFPLTMQTANIETMDQRVAGLLQAWPLFSVGPVLQIWWQNVRALLLAAVLGAFSMGILGTLPIFATMGVLGFVLGVLSNSGVSPLPFFLGLVLPHGILEIPAAIIASAAVLQAGAIIATPTPGRTIGEAWIESLAEWAKIMLGFVIPILLLAAGVEAWLTPRIALLLS